MATQKRPIPVFNTARIVEDMTSKGLDIMALARITGRHHATIRRFLEGSVQTTKTATQIAGALGYSVRRYVSGVKEAA